MIVFARLVAELQTIVYNDRLTRLQIEPETPKEFLVQHQANSFERLMSTHLAATYHRFAFAK